MPTPNYGMVLPTDDDSMSDTTTYLNNNFSKIQNAISATSVDTLPITDFSYSLGDKIYYTPHKSIYVLIASNAAWGNFWRPIQHRYGPWVRPADSTVISNFGTLYTTNADTNWFEYMISNTGKMHLRGAIDSVDANGFKDRTIGTSPGVFNQMPRAIAPRYRKIMIAAIYRQNSSFANPQFAQLSFHPDGTITNTFWNPDVLGTSLYFDGVQWDMGYTNGYGSDN